MRAFATGVVALRAVIPLAWIAAAVLVTVTLPPLGSTGSAPLDDLVSQGGAAARQQAQATRTFGFPLYTDTVVVQRDANGLPPGAQEQTARAALAVRQHKTTDLPKLRAVLPVSDDLDAPLDPGNKATTALSYLFFDDSANLDTRRDVATHYGEKYLADDVVGVTGAAPARLAQYEEIQDALPIVEAASIALVLLITGLAFRSFGAPLVTLFTAGIAYLITIRVLPYAGEKAGASVPAEVEPIIVVLLLGLVTDYSVFFLSETRRRLRRGQSRVQAAHAATRRTAPIVFTAGLIVAAGTGALVVGKLGFFRAFGPGLALTTLISLLVSVTLVPALMALFGARLFGGRAEERERAEPSNGNGRLFQHTRDLASIAQTSHWRLIVARIASARAVALPIAIGCIAVLVFLAMFTRGTELGLGFISALPAGNEVREAATAASDGFAPGVLSPTEIDLQQPGIATRTAQLDRLEGLLGKEPGVAAVIGPSRQPPAPAPRILVTPDGNAARFAVILDSDPLGAPAIHHLQDLRDRLPALMRASGLAGVPTAVGGETALADATVDGVLHDLRRIGVVAIAVNLLLLMLFLRAVIAPLYLVGVSVLGLAASLGLTTFVFQHVLGADDLTYYVPFAAAVLLVALGSDYNVFVAGRIWEEARWMRLRDAIAVATPAAAKAVTVAGIALAASFALLVAVPLRSFREFAFVMAAGVLIDTFLVRSMLVPALTSLFGEAAWWPGRRLRGMPADEIVERVADRTRLPFEEADLLTRGTLTALGERIPTGELAPRLPPELRAALERSGGEPKAFSPDEFLERARARAGGEGIDDDEMRGYAGAVLATLEDAVPDVRDQLPEDYGKLFA